MKTVERKWKAVLRVASPAFLLFFPLARFPHPPLLDILPHSPSGSIDFSRDLTDNV